MRLVQTTIHCTKAIRELWPNPLARQWLQQYPDLFDRDDLRLTVNQPRSHFCEWFAAIHLFHREGAHSLVEKYVHQSHSAKVARLAALLSERERRTLNAIRDAYAVQLPDLFVFLPKTSRYWFAEVKGPGGSFMVLDSRDVVVSDRFASNAERVRSELLAARGKRMVSSSMAASYEILATYDRPHLMSHQSSRRLQ